MYEVSILFTSDDPSYTGDIHLVSFKHRSSKPGTEVFLAAMEAWLRQSNKSVLFDMDNLVELIGVGKEIDLLAEYGVYNLKIETPVFTGVLSVDQPLGLFPD